MKTITEQEIKEAAEHHTDIQYPMGVEREYPINDFTAGINWLQERYAVEIRKLITIQERSSARYKACFGKVNPQGHQVFDLFAAELKKLLPEPQRKDVSNG
ncbi:hypothetical protein [Pedobacter panaciterrae]